jgi:hypothetical protein
MKRYYKNGEGFNFDDDDEDEDLQEDEDGEGYIDVDADDLVDAMKMDLVEIHLNQRLLDKAIEIAQKDWFWFFRSPARKSRIIKKIYNDLNKLMNGE